MGGGAGQREFTFTALALGVAMAVAFGAANAYLGLRVGLTVSASIPAAVVSMGILRVAMRRDSILENNMVQTIASAGESLAAGAIFTMPAMYLWAEEGLCAPPGMFPLAVMALAGGVLGVLLMVPLRRPLIVEEDATLVYPEGRACADVLKAGEGGAGRAKTVFLGFAVAAAVKVVTDVLKWIPAAVSHSFGRLRGAIGMEIAPALLGVGYVAGPKAATLLFAGSLLGWMVLMPLCCALMPDAAALWEKGGARLVWSECIRYIGAGAIAAGGVISVVKSIPLFVRTFRAAKGAMQASSAERDLPLPRVFAGVAAVIALLWAAPAVPVGLCGAVLIAVFGFFFAAVSARMVGFVGSSNNPVSGMTIVTLVVAALALKATGAAGAAGMLAAMSVGSVVCIVSAIAGDTAQDLKTGRILGATPWRQQVGELVGVAASAVAIGGVLALLHAAWGFGSEQLAAPQATLMKVVVEGIMGSSLPWELIAAGAAIAVVLAVCRVPVMPCAIGIYLPVGVNAAIFVGGAARYLADRRSTSSAADSPGTLFAAGLVAGEGLCGILLALVALMCR